MNLNRNKITFIDLYSGIGGYRLALERLGLKCVWSCDINEYANQVYEKQFGGENHYKGDIRQVNVKDIPEHDILCAGFPCPSFSYAGERKGFKDVRGTLFFEICRIAKAKRPALLFLENVRGLLSNDKGATFGIILESLSKLGYLLEWQVLDSKHFGVPQTRPRVFIIGHLRGGGGREIFPITPDDLFNIREGEREDGRRTVDTILIQTAHRGDRWGKNIKKQNYSDTLDSGGTLGIGRVISIETAHTKANMREGRFGKIMKALDSGGSKAVLIHRGWSGIEDSPRVYDNYSPTITTPVGGRHLPELLRGYEFRKLTPIEMERLQGFPDNWTEGISDIQRSKCLGNAVTVNVIEYIGGLLINNCFNG